MRRAPHEPQMPERRLQENGTSRSKPHDGQ
jgi:hypothetical protein